MNVWPNFFIVGAGRTATTSLYEYFRSYPEIFMSLKKEPKYFLGKPIDNKDPIQRKKEYLKLFKNVKNESAIGEASARYMIDPDSPRLIYESIPNAKIIIILRDPVERAFSAYFYFVNYGLEKLSFSESIRKEYKYENEDTNHYLILHPGFYSKSVKKYLELFGTDNVKILIFEEFINDIKSQVLDVLRFLNVNVDYDFEVKRYNEFGVLRGKTAEKILTSKIVAKIAKYFNERTRKFVYKKFFLNTNVKKPKMRQNDRLFLENLYYEDVVELQKILNISLPWFNNKINSQS